MEIISYFAEGTLTNPAATPADCTFEQFAAAVKGGTWAAPIAVVRREKDPQKQDVLKKALPYVTPAARCRGKRSNETAEASGLAPLDIDNFEGPPEIVRDTLAKLPWIRFTALSCRGNGVVAVIRCEPGNHAAAVAWATEELVRLYGGDYKPAKGQADLARARFVTYDPAAHDNPAAPVCPPPGWTPPAPKEKPAAPAPKPVPVPENANREARWYAKCAENKCKQAAREIATAPDGTKYPTMVSWAIALGGYVGGGQISRSDAEAALNTIFSRQLNNTQTAKNGMEWGLRVGAEKPLYFPAPAPKTPQHATPATPAGQPAPEEDEDDIEIPAAPQTEWAGNPMLESHLFRYLPDPFPALLERLEGRQRDMAVISALVSLSGLFPEVSGMYGGNRTWPNLYGFVVAHPGTGKNIIDRAPDLGHAAAREIAERNAQKLAEWQLENEAYKAAKKGTAPDPGAPPAPERLFISANATSKALIDALSKNASIIMTETEADTIAGMFKSDHGDFSDVLRKAFEHERIGALRVVAESVEAECPRLSLMIAGTPDQLPKIVKNAANGLFSRFMFYAHDELPVFKSPFAQNDDKKALWQGASEVVQTARDAGGFDFTLSPEQIESFCALFGGLHKRYLGTRGPYASGIVFRAGKILFRIAMILTRLERGGQYFGGGTVVCSEIMYIIAESFTATLLKHSFAVLGALDGLTDEPEAKEARRTIDALFDALEAEFTTAEAVKAAAELGASAPTAKRCVGKYVASGLAKKEGRGLYKKVKP